MSTWPTRIHNRVRHEPDPINNRVETSNPNTTLVTRCDFVFVFISGFSALLLASSSSQFLSCTRTSLLPHLSLIGTTTTSPTHKTTWTPMFQPPPLRCPRRQRFHFRRQKSTSSKKIHSNKTNQRKKMQKATDRIGLGFQATFSTISADSSGPSGGRSTNARSSGMTTDDRSGSDF
jgi:hypothetical protein